VGRDSIVHPLTHLMGATSVGSGCEIGPGSVLRDATVADGARVVQSHVQGCAVGPGATVGPFSYLRPGTVLDNGAKAGAFVEIKNSHVGPGSKVPHLSYIGDTEIGTGANIGAGTITANYDGFHKHRTTIGDGVRTGSDTCFVAPVQVGDGAFTGAGSVITRDVPAGALGIARGRQQNIERYAERRLRRDAAEPPPAPEAESSPDGPSATDGAPPPDDPPAPEPPPGRQATDAP
ncbi:MAG TPA: bifunctional UDP-N-acetylglucosamine diphosphorylase/glucosamine-1-phosphate N-acetyltransferase GlmU, partial [Thermoleophilia bacterium]|nr:bifunctional UDP-N-acetylglucosamine diphosphorylase/glucosamine-1-phosphate N-acetyltransferase GlmU [Thermoleophilia bacterium]